MMSSPTKIKSPNNYWLSVGLGVGLVYGLLVKNIGLGIIIGTLLGVAGDSFATRKHSDVV